MQVELPDIQTRCLVAADGLKWSGLAQWNWRRFLQNYDLSGIIKPELHEDIKPYVACFSHDGLLLSPHCQYFHLKKSFVSLMLIVAPLLHLEPKRGSLFWTLWIYWRWLVKVNTTYVFEGHVQGPWSANNIYDYMKTKLFLISRWFIVWPEVANMLL